MKKTTVGPDGKTYEVVASGHIGDLADPESELSKYLDGLADELAPLLGDEDYLASLKKKTYIW